MSNLEQIRDIIYQPANPETWSHLFNALQSWTGEDPLDVALTYCRDHMAAWPKDLPTFAPPGWLQRPASTIEKDPLLPFIAFATGERTEIFKARSEALLDDARSVKPPRFLALEAMGQMRWRGGEPLDEKQLKKLIAVIKTAAAREAGDEDLYRLRHFLNDDDCQRWSAYIHKSWEEAGSKSPHRWSLFQVAVMGKTSDISISPNSISEMHHTRAAQYMSILAFSDSEEALTQFKDVALGLPMHRAARKTAVRLLKDAAKKRGKPLLRMLQEDIDLFAANAKREAKLIKSLDGKEALNDAHTEALMEVLESALVSQRFWSWSELRDGLLATRALHPVFQSLVWRIFDNGQLFRWTPDGPVTDKGNPKALKDNIRITLAHPAQMGQRKREQWSKHLDQEGLQQEFEQLERPIWTRKSPLISSPVPVHSAFFFEKTPWIIGEPIGGGYCDTLRLLPKDTLWYAEISLTFLLHLNEHITIDNENVPNAIDGLSVRDRFNGAIPWSRDSIAYSEASRFVAKLIEAIEPPQD